MNFNWCAGDSSSKRFIAPILFVVNYTICPVQFISIPDQTDPPKLLITVVSVVVGSANVMYVWKWNFSFSIRIATGSPLQLNIINNNTTTTCSVKRTVLHAKSAAHLMGHPKIVDVRRGQLNSSGASLCQPVSSSDSLLRPLLIIIEKKHRSEARHSLVTVLLFLLAAAE